MSADLAPWEIEDEQPAVPMYPMQLEEYDAIRDDLRTAYLRAPWMLPALINTAVAALGTIAQTGTEADNKLATQALRHLLRDAMEAAS